MVNLETIQKDIASLPLDAQQTIIELVDILKKRYSPNQQEIKEQGTQDLRLCLKAIFRSNLKGAFPGRTWERDNEIGRTK